MYSITQDLVTYRRGGSAPNKSYGSQAGAGDDVVEDCIAGSFCHVDCCGIVDKLIVRNPRRLAKSVPTEGIVADVVLTGEWLDIDAPPAIFYDAVTNDVVVAK